MDENTFENQATEKAMNPAALVVVVVLVVGLGLGMLVMGKKPTTESETVADASLQTEESVIEPEVEGLATESGEESLQVVSIEAGSFYYKPNEIRVKKGEKVRVEFKAVDMMHDFNVDELSIKSPVTKSGETSVFEFTADTAGIFGYYCSVGQHRKMGQIGTLIVEE